MPRGIILTVEFLEYRESTIKTAGLGWT